MIFFCFFGEVGGGDRDRRREKRKQDISLVDINKKEERNEGMKRKLS